MKLKCLMHGVRVQIDEEEVTSRKRPDVVLGTRPVVRHRTIHLGQCDGVFVQLGSQRFDVDTMVRLLWERRELRTRNRV